MFVVLDVGDCLIQITVWTYARGGKTVLDLAQEFFDDWNSIFANDDSFHFNRLNLSVPLVSADVIYQESLLRICVQHFPDQVFRCFRNYPRDQVVAVQDLLVQLACVWVFEREVTASHGIEDDTTTPNVRIETVVLFASDHFRSCVAWTSTGSFQSLPFLVHVGQTKVNNFDIILVI